MIQTRPTPRPAILLPFGKAALDLAQLGGGKFACPAYPHRLGNQNFKANPNPGGNIHQRDRARNRGDADGIRRWPPNSGNSTDMKYLSDMFSGVGAKPVNL